MNKIKKNKGEKQNEKYQRTIRNYEEESTQGLFQQVHSRHQSKSN